MSDVRKLLKQVAAEEKAFAGAVFVAPCVRGGRVRTRFMGLVRTYRPRPHDFEGWGLFHPVNDREAELVEEAGLPVVSRYLELFPRLRLLLVQALRGSTWLAYPANEATMLQRFGRVCPIPIHLVTEGARFETVVAHFDGGAWWCGEVDRRADPEHAERLRESLRQTVLPAELRFSGLTPEMRTAYELAAYQTAEFTVLGQQRRDEARLGQALRMAGGALCDFHDRGEFWQVEWTTRDGERHSSAISKRNLTVLSSGICLSDQNSDFDLQSLVGVIERREDDDY